MPPVLPATSRNGTSRAGTSCATQARAVGKIGPQASPSSTKAGEANPGNALRAAARTVRKAEALTTRAGTSRAPISPTSTRDTVIPPQKALTTTAAFWTPSVLRYLPAQAPAPTSRPT